MYYYTCAPTIEAMLSCIYVAWSSKRGHQNIKLLLEPVSQYTLFDEYIHVDASERMVESVMDAVNHKISPYFYHQLMYTAMAYEEDALDNIFHCMILGFALGPSTLDMFQYRDVMRHQEIAHRLGNEVCRFKEFARFHQIGSAYVAHIEPRSRIIPALGPIFEDRMPSEHWMIIDDIHREAVIHPKDDDFYIKQLSDQEFIRLLDTENENDDYTDMWRTFFHAITIQQRANYRCQRSHFPIMYRDHAVEFQ